MRNYYYENVRLDNSNKIPFDYIFSYTLASIYKIRLNDDDTNYRKVVSISEWRKYLNFV